MYIITLLFIIFLTLFFQTVSSENWIEPKSGIQVNSFALSTINRKSTSKMISDLMVIIFTDDELRNGSVRVVSHYDGYAARRNRRRQTV